MTRVVGYLFFCVLGLWLCSYTYRDFSWEELVVGLRRVRVRWVLAGLAAHLANHLLRAYRWRYLIATQGHRVGLGRAFMAEMVGFFTNLFVPRLGEWTRCRVLKRLQGIPVAHALAAVVVERFLDLLAMIGLVGSILCLGAAHMWGILYRVWDLVAMPFLALRLASWLSWALWTGVVVVGVVLAARLLRRSNAFVQGLARALRASFGPYKAPVGLGTLLVWACAWLFEWVSFGALAETAGLDFWVALHTMVVCNLGAAIPVPGGIGSYHMLMSFALMGFGVGAPAALLYATLAHGMQLANGLVVGGLATVLSVTVKPAGLA